MGPLLGQDGNGTYAVKTFHGDKVTTLAGPVAHAAVSKADAAGKSVNTVGWRVQGGTAACVINGTAAASEWRRKPRRFRDAMWWR